MITKKKDFFWGFGSAGLTSLFYLNKKFDQNTGNALFVKNKPGTMGIWRNRNRLTNQRMLLVIVKGKQKAL